jgi:hypothetical protein|tara:strand:+ start:1016 stop:1321 length:306 start_codon:yes stop_codon:yes gene_type:complete
LTIRLTAPISYDTAASTAYLGDNDLTITGARLIQVGLQGDAGLEAGTLKIRIAEGHQVELGLVASNIYTIQMPTGCSSCLPLIQLDIKAAAGTPKIVVLAV